MFGNLIRECGVLNSLSETAQKTLANLITLFLGITIAVRRCSAEQFLTRQHASDPGASVWSRSCSTRSGGVLVAKFLNLFLRRRRSTR